MKKTETAEMAETVENTEKVFLKESILKSKRFSRYRDALSFLLKDGEFYSMEQVDNILDEFMKGSVK